MSDGPEVLVASSDPRNRRALANIVGECGLKAVVSSSVSEVQATMTRESICLVFCEDRLPDGSFRDVLRTVAECRSPVLLVMFSRLCDWKCYLEAMQLGAFDCIAPPYRRNEIERIVRNALRLSPGRTGVPGLATS